MKSVLFSIGLFTLSAAMIWADPPAAVPSDQQVAEIRASLFRKVNGVCAVEVDRQTEEKVLYVILPVGTDDYRLQNLPPIPCAFALSLDSSEVTDAGLSKLRGMSNLIGLSLSKTAITDAGLKEIALLPNLTSLSLDQTKVTDAGLKELAKISSLRRLSLEETKVTEVNLAVLRKALPKCTIRK